MGAGEQQLPLRSAARFSLLSPRLLREKISCDFSRSAMQSATSALLFLCLGAQGFQKILLLLESFSVPTAAWRAAVWWNAPLKC